MNVNNFDPSSNLLSRLTIENFKSLDTVHIELKPLTLLVGQNSVGKSSSFQALMTLTQWLREASPLANYYLNGPQVRVGSFMQARSSNRVHYPIKIGVGTLKDSIQVSVLGNGSIEEEEYGKPHIVGFEVRGEGFTASMSNYGYPTGYWLRFAPQIIESDNPEYDELDRNDIPARIPFTFGPVSFTREGDDVHPADLDILSLRDFCNVNVKRELNLVNWLDSRLGELAAIQADLELLALSNSEIILEYQGLEEFISKLFKGKGEDWKPSRFKFPDRDSDIGNSLISMATQISETKKDGYSILTSVLTELEIRLSESAPIPWERAMGHLYRTPISIPRFESYYPHSELQTEPYDSLGQEDREKIARLLEDLGYSQAFDLLMESIGDAEMLVERIHFNEKTLWHAQRNNDRFGDSWVKTPKHKAEHDFKSFEEFLTSRISYLGPLRVDGFTRTLRGTAIPSGSPVGSSGEHTPLLLLDLITNNQVSKLPIFDYDKGDWSIQEVTFKQAITSWFRLFTVPEGELTVEDSGKFGVQVEMAGRTLDQFGTGASQVLPILALILSRQPGDVVLLEQPELHLHPGGQQYLADLFMAAMENGIQIILETHSEYIVNRIRRGIVLKSISSELVQMVNFEQNRDGSANVSNVSMTESGGFADWPKGFFAQTEEDLLDIIEALEMGENPRN